MNKISTLKSLIEAQIREPYVPTTQAERDAMASKYASEREAHKRANPPIANVAKARMHGILTGNINPDHYTQTREYELAKKVSDQSLGDKHKYTKAVFKTFEGGLYAVLYKTDGTADVYDEFSKVKDPDIVNAVVSNDASQTMYDKGLDADAINKRHAERIDREERELLGSDYDDVMAMRKVLDKHGTDYGAAAEELKSMIKSKEAPSTNGDPFDL